MAAPIFREGFVDVNGVPTHVLTCGGWIDEGSHEELVVCVSGNPGLGGYYRPFLATLHTRLGFPVWIVSHAGHVVPTAGETSRRLPSLRNHADKYDLQGQVDHKKAFLSAYLPAQVRLHLVGHSIGCKMVMDLMKDPNLRGRVVRSHLLFPTVERMALSPNGRFLTRFVLPVSGTLVFLSQIFTWLPRFLQSLLVKGFFVARRRGAEAVDVTVRLVNPGVLARVFHLAADEMEKVVDLDEAALREFGDRLHFYYGVRDGWAPLSYCEDLRGKYPDLQVETCTQNVDHAFVLGSGEEMGELVAKWIQEDRCCVL